MSEKEKNEAASVEVQQDDHPVDGSEAGEPKQGGESGLAEQLRAASAELTKIQQERAELRERLARLEGAINSVVAARESGRAKADEDPFAFLDSSDLREKFYEDAAVPIAAMKQIVGLIGRALAERDSMWREEIVKLRGMINRPDEAVAEKIAELKADPRLAGASEDVLQAIAERMVEKKPPKKEYPGTAPTSGRVATRSGLHPDDERAVREVMARMGY